ncbi:RND superfamily protein [Minicystis rosea]|nr:RND superfamily protein [Minicystis rosea]
MVITVVALLSACALALAARLELLMGFESLLPDARPSVQELRRVAARTSGVSTLFVVLEGEDPHALRCTGDALVPALIALGLPWVGQAEDGVHDAAKFLTPRAGLYADLKGLEQLRDDVEARVAYEVGEQTGSNLPLDPADVPPPLDADLLKKRLGVNAADEKRFPDGYYQSQDGKTLVVAIRSAVMASDFTKGREAMARVRAVVEQVSPRSFDPTAKWGITGDLAIGVGEYDAINRDLTEVGVAGALLILGVVSLYYLRLRAVVAMSITIAVGLAWTFGLTQLALGHLNLATGFLFTIIGGNGINFSIIYMARYLEERRSGRSLSQAITVAHLETWKPTLTAAAAASAAYGSLVITAFRGFREFGIVGGAGMAICWLATYLLLPAVLVVMERVVPLDRVRSGLVGKIQRATDVGIPFGEPFARLVERAPRFLTVVGLALTCAGVDLAARYLRTDPMEYDLAQVQSDQRVVGEAQRLIHAAKAITGYIGLDGMAILVDRVEQVPPLKRALEARRDAAPAGAKPFKALHALQDFVPADQREKLDILSRLAERARWARRRGLVRDADWSKIEPFLPTSEVQPFGIADLPDALARPFTERDGTRGRVVYISPTDGELTSDARYLFRWADSFRRTALPDGSVVLGSGRAVIYADMWSAILDDVPPAVCLSFTATFLIVIAAFRGRRASLGILAALLIGVSWMAGLLALLGAKLNFLNFIALPITFGIGVDYAVNIVERDCHLRDALGALRRTGGAVILCSLTTLLGYLALVKSMNHAVRSLGVAAVIGEIACLLAAVLVLPAALVWWRSRAWGVRKSSDSAI